MNQITVFRRYSPSALVFIVFLGVQGCSGNRFHLREPVSLSGNTKTIQLSGLSANSGFSLAFRNALEEAGGDISGKASTHLMISDLREGKRVVAYNSQRKARIYLLFLKFKYQIQRVGQSTSIKHRINVDRSFVYDANFALGKVEEENKIRQNLYKEAARLVLLPLQHSAE